MYIVLHDIAFLEFILNLLTLRIKNKLQKINDWMLKVTHWNIYVTVVVIVIDSS